MSRGATRARKRCARTQEEIIALLDQATNPSSFEDRVAAMDALANLLRRLAQSSDICLWDHAQQVVGDYENGASIEEAEETKAMIAQLVAPTLSGQPPRWVRHRIPEEGVSLESTVSASPSLDWSPCNEGNEHE
jgi:hypothetical protein